MALYDDKLDKIVARRLAIELRASDEDICGKIRHLEVSIGTSRDKLHPLLVRTLSEICH